MADQFAYENYSQQHYARMSQVFAAERDLNRASASQSPITRKGEVNPTLPACMQTPFYVLISVAP